MRYARCVICDKNNMSDTLVRNPFQYGGVVGGSSFCNRRKELADLLRAIENGEKLFLYSERRLGKTSLIKYAFSQLAKKRDFATAYVDLWSTDDAASFVTTTAKAVAESMGRTAEQLLETGKTLFSRLSPSVSVGEDGKPTISFGLKSNKEPGPEIEEVLAAPAKLADEKKVVVVFDEVQRILEYEGDQIERRLRGIIQTQANVSYIFMGSRKHLVQQMFLHKSRPLYRAAGHYPLGPIAAPEWIPFIGEKFRKAAKTISDETILAIVDLTQGHPFYTQHLCHALWELCEAGSEVKKESIQTGLKVLLDRESYAYTSLWESLALNQRRLMKGLTFEPRGVKPFSTDFIGRYGLGSPSNAQRAIEGLLNKDIIDRDNGSFIISDRFFRIWIQQTEQK